MQTPIRALDFACPVCGAQPLERCKLLGGGPRVESHLERKYIAKDHVIKKSSAKPPRARTQIKQV